MVANKKLTIGHIDSASLHGVIAALGYQNIDQWPLWTLWSAAEVTSALINDPMFEIAPGPGTYAGDYGLMDHTMRSLALIISKSQPRNAWREKATNRVKRWVGRYPLNVRKAYEKVRADPSFQGWLDYSIRNFLVEHSASLDGLFDPIFIPQLSTVLNCSANELRDIWQKSRDLKQVDEWSKKQPDTDDFKLVIDAFVLAAIIRGRYHEYVAEEAGWQVIHHPIRYAILPMKKQSAEFPLTNTEKYFVGIILASAFSEKKIKDRISLWANNVVEAKKAVKIGVIDLSGRDSNSMAESLALDAAKRLNLRTYSRLSAAIFDALSILLISSLTSFALYAWGVPPWVGLPVGPGTTAVIRYKTGKGIGDKAASLFSQRDMRLRDLSQVVPGRVKGNWC
jgi:hypothetical protein